MYCFCHFCWFCRCCSFSPFVFLHKNCFRFLYVSTIWKRVFFCFIDILFMLITSRDPIWNRKYLPFFLSFFTLFRHFQMKFRYEESRVNQINKFDPFFFSVSCRAIFVEQNSFYIVYSYWYETNCSIATYRSFLTYKKKTNQRIEMCWHRYVLIIFMMNNDWKSVGFVRVRRCVLILLLFRFQSRCQHHVCKYVIQAMNNNNGWQSTTTDSNHNIKKKYRV